MLERIPERARTRKVAEAVVSPSAFLLAGAGASLAILGGLPLAVAALAGVAGWAARVAMAVPKKVPTEVINPKLLKEPWRHFVLDAQQARARFQTAVQQTRSGPLRERLELVGRRLDDGVTECWRIARQGNTLEGAFAQLDVASVQAELEALRGERDSPSRDRTEQALRSQLASAERLSTVAHDARDRLRLLNAQLDEAVARAVELSISAGDAAAFTPLTDDVESLVGEMEALRQALEETTGSAAGGTTATA